MIINNKNYYREHNYLLRQWNSIGIETRQNNYLLFHRYNRFSSKLEWSNDNELCVPFRSTRKKKNKNSILKIIIVLIYFKFKLTRRYFSVTQKRPLGFGLTLIFNKMYLFIFLLIFRLPS